MVPSVAFKRVSKAYRLGGGRGSLREALSDIGGFLVGRSRNGEQHLLWPLKDISFEVQPAEGVGIIGPNGAGKTTILKLISRITHPTYGRVDVRGRVSALIELGAGFHPDLTGRENILLNAAILGMPLKEAQRRFDEIVEFSGLEHFLDTPVKRYSSGMYVRLAFSVAAHVQTDILLVDEVLAVGDAEFSQRCLRRMRELRRAGATILFVSHNFYLVESICDRCLFLANGQIRSQGNVAEVMESYEQWRQQEQSPHSAWIAATPGAPLDSGDAQITRVEIGRHLGAATRELNHDEAAEIRVHYRTTRCVRNPNLYVQILGKNGTCAMIRTADYGILLDDLDGAGAIRVVVDPLQLTPGTYAIHAALFEGSDYVVLAEGVSASFRVPGNRVGREGVFVPRLAWAGVDRQTSSGVPNLTKTR